MTVSTSTINAQCVQNVTTRTVIETTMNGVAGYLTASLLQINPATGAIFGIVQGVIGPIVTRLLNNQATSAKRVQAYAASFFLKVLAAVFITIAIGAKITFGSAVWLSIFMSPIGLFLNCCFGAKAVVKEVKNVASRVINRTKQRYQNSISR